MANFARIINGMAVDVSAAPAEHFHPILAAEFQPVPDDVAPGWRLVGEEWRAPEYVTEPVPEPATVYPQVSPVQYQLLFTAEERLAIKAARPTDPVIDDMYSLLEDPRLTHVDLGLKSTQDALLYLQSKGFISEARRLEILTGNLQ